MIAPISPPAAVPAPVSGFTTIALWGASITVNPSVIVLSIAILGMGWLIYLAQKSAKPFDLRDLLMEGDKLSPTRTAFISAFLMTSWVIVDLEIKARLTEGLFVGYLLAWVGPLTAKVIFNKTDVNFPLRKDDR